MEELSRVQKQIRDVLIRCAQDGHTITYSDLGDEIRKPTRWRHWKDNLDAIAEYEKTHDRPDLTLVVVQKSSGLPSVYKGEDLESNDREGVEEYKSDLEGVFREWDKAR